MKRVLAPRCRGHQTLVCTGYQLLYAAQSCYCKAVAKGMYSTQAKLCLVAHYCVAQVAKLNVPYVLMHMRGDPKTMQRLTDYTDTCLEVGQELQAQAEAAMAAGIEPWRIILDPGAATAPVCLPPTLCMHNTAVQVAGLLRDVPFRKCTCVECSALECFW